MRAQSLLGQGQRRDTTSLPSMNTRAPRGRESMKIEPVADAPGFEGDVAPGEAVVRASGAGARLSAGTRRNSTSTVRNAALSDSVKRSRAASLPVCTTRTSYLPNLTLSSVNGVRPLHLPLIVTLAFAGFDVTTRRPVVTGRARGGAVVSAS